MPAGRPSTGCSPMGRTTAPRQDPTVAQCTNVPMHTVHQTQVGAHHSGALWHHLGARDPTAGGGWWQPLNPTWLKAGQTQKPVSTQLIGGRAVYGGRLSAWTKANPTRANHKKAKKVKTKTESRPDFHRAGVRPQSFKIGPRVCWTQVSKQHIQDTQDQDS